MNRRVKMAAIAVTTLSLVAVGGVAANADVPTRTPPVNIYL
jgi:hypothetical protein